MDLSQAYRVEEGEFLRRVRRAYVQPDDIVYGREGERWGFAAIVPEYPIVCLGQRMMQFRAGGHFHSRFLMWHLNADCVYQQGALDTAGSTAPHVNVETIKNYWLVEPPRDEQVKIAAFLDGASNRHDVQFSLARQAIAKLKEYRSALITNTVTGKIDVRDFKIPDLSAKELCDA
jgi:type I restriction enzyme S subunit